MPLSELAKRLEVRVRHLAEEIGPRHFQKPEALTRASKFIESELEMLGVPPERHPFQAAGMEFVNLAVRLLGEENEQRPAIVVGAHYDTVPETPGADDNASAVGALLEFASQFKGRRFKRPVHLVFFPNEEPPFYPDAGMGSAAYAAELKSQGAQVRVMLSLEMLGYYSDVPGSQKYPPGMGAFYPNTGNFIGFVGNLKSRKRVAEVKAAFKASTQFPCESLAAPEWTIVVGLSDHKSFWTEGYPGLMVTDTAFMRNPHYHRPSDTPDTLDYARYAEVTQGLIDAVARLAQE
jgi:Zn-dependent M28 family amino/carboxypeptidase